MTFYANLFSTKKERKNVVRTKRGIVNQGGIRNLPKQKEQVKRKYI